MGGLPCFNDGMCPEGHVCKNGFCEKPPLVGACSTDADCPVGYHCKVDECVPDECTSNADCPQGFTCRDGQCSPRQQVACEEDSDCAQGWVCVNGDCKEDPDYEEDGNGDGDGDGNGGDGDGDDGTEMMFGWSDRLQGLLDRLNDRIQYLLENPRGATPEERQAIINFAKKGILRGERGRLQSTKDAMARQGLLDSPFMASELNKIRRGTAEDVADLEHRVLSDELDRRFKELIGTTGMANELLGASMDSERLVEILNAARRGESQEALAMILAYFSTLYGNQDNSYWQAILGAGLS